MIPSPNRMTGDSATSRMTVLLRTQPNHVRGFKSQEASGAEAPENCSCVDENSNKKSRVDWIPALVENVCPDHLTGLPGGGECDDP